MTVYRVRRSAAPDPVRRSDEYTRTYVHGCTRDAAVTVAEYGNNRNDGRTYWVEVEPV